ncbi:TetR/AcrR family transcriptional regulator [Gordonia sp. OPL2]|uniref:TetR/AcrR family transcriptional regulator n=1 Tax=Gordonia sp. OPL2 TaxID=2486274 RepID=UPI001654FF43|nr:TetR/AcrR family transcriptional regulator [Gordonia sp. OPL2]ROZ99076.1 TetR/AcrR family transcriptional regulator [Gordonia sp. OPL2]
MPVATEVREDGPRSKRARILTVAIEQFGKVGYEHTKWASVAGEVGIGQTALYHYFESKAHCLLTIMRLELTDSVGRFQAGIAGITDPEGALRAAVAASLAGEPIDALQRRILQNHMDILSTPRQSDKEEAERLRSREVVAEIEKNWAALIKRGMDSGVFVDGDPVLYARLVLGVVVSVWRWYRPGGPLSLDDLTRQVSDSVLRMVARE